MCVMVPTDNRNKFIAPPCLVGRVTITNPFFLLADMTLRVGRGKRIEGGDGRFQVIAVDTTELYYLSKRWVCIKAGIIVLKFS